MDSLRTEFEKIPGNKAHVEWRAGCDDDDGRRVMYYVSSWWIFGSAVRGFGTADAIPVVTADATHFSFMAKQQVCVHELIGPAVTVYVLAVLNPR